MEVANRYPVSSKVVNLDHRYQRKKQGKTHVVMKERLALALGSEAIESIQSIIGIGKGGGLGAKTLSLILRFSIGHLIFYDTRLFLL